MKLFRPPRFLKLLYNKRTWGFSLHEKVIYLSFDDGPHPDITPWILDELEKFQIKATFFCVGENVARYPEIFNRIMAEGHSVGNHTMRHENANKTSSKNYLQSISEANKLIDSRIFRPPYGRLSPCLAYKISKKYNIIMWSWLSYDFDSKISVENILEKANYQIKNGDILVLHDNPKIKEKQKELLPKLLKLLRQKSFDFKLLDKN